MQWGGRLVKKMKNERFGSRHGKVEEILNVHKLLTQSLHVDDVLKTLVKCARDLVEVADTVILYLYDNARWKVKNGREEGVGVDKDHIKTYCIFSG